MSDHKTPLLLASSSVYRAELLARLGLDFIQVDPNIDESQQAGEPVKSLVLRLAEQKARAVVIQNPASTVIGSDQVCTFANQLCGKPHTVANAIRQLQTFSNNSVEFFTALCVISADGQCYQDVDRTVVKFRTLNLKEIQRYIEKEQPLNCAGSFKVESLGLSLFKSVETKDPSALIGLPLIKLSAFLRQAGYQIP